MQKEQVKNKLRDHIKHIAILLIVILSAVWMTGKYSFDEKAIPSTQDNNGATNNSPIEKPKELVKMPVPLNYWVHFDPETATKYLSAYGEFFNVTMDKNIYLTSVETKDFARVELHTTKNGKDIIADDDKPFLLPPMGGSVKLQYGGNYILLIAPKKIIKDGDITTITLNYRVENSSEILSSNLEFSVTSNGIGCGAIPKNK